MNVKGKFGVNPIIDVFKIGVHIGMTSNATQVLQTMLRHLTGVHASAKQINAQFATMAKLAGGAVLAIGGFKALEGIWHVVTGAKKLNDELTRTQMLGGAFASTIGAARSNAFSTARQVPNYTASDIVRMQRELGTQLEHPTAAFELAGAAAKAAAVVSHYTGEDSETIVKNLIKIIDLRAKLFSMGPDGKEHIDHNKLGPEMEAVVKGLILGGNYIKSNDMLMMARQMGVAVKTMTIEGFYAAMTEMAVSQGAARTGTAVTSLFSQLVGGTMTMKTAVEMQKMGLMKGDEWSHVYGKVVVGGAATSRFQEALKDPIGYITGPLNDLLTAKGMTSDQKIMEVFRLFGRQTTQRLIAEALSAGPQFERARGMFGDIPGTDENYKMLMNANLSMNMTAFSSSWHTLIESLGDNGIPAAITMLKGLTWALGGLTSLSEKHPNIATGLLSVAAGVSALAALGGSIAVLSMGLRVLAPALGLLTAVPGLSLLGGALSSIAAGLGKLAGPIGALYAAFDFLRGTAAGDVKQENEALGGTPGSRFPGLVRPETGPRPGWTEWWYGANSPEATRKRRQWQNEQDEKKIQEQGLDEHHRPVGSQSWMAPGGNATPVIQTVTYIQLDGRTIAKAVSSEQGRAMSLPPNGATRFDGRIAPSYPGNTVMA